MWSSWCSGGRSRSSSWSWSRSSSWSRGWSWSWSWSRLSGCLRGVNLDLCNVGDVERLEVELDSAGRYDSSSRPGRGRGRSGGHSLQSRLGGGSRHHRGGAGTGRGRTVLEVELNSALDVLLESCLECAAVLVEGD